MKRRSIIGSLGLCALLTLLGGEPAVALGSGPDGSAGDASLGEAGHGGQAADLADLLLSRQDGTVALSYATRPGVRGNRKGYHLCADGKARPNDHPGLCRLRLSFRHGKLRDVDLWVDAGEDELAADLDLGSVPAPAAASALLELAARGKGKALPELLPAACIAKDAVVWPRLLDLARDESRSEEMREDSVFWLGQEAGDAVTAGLEAILDDEDAGLTLRERAIFSLSQRPLDDCFPVLKRVALESPHPQLRRQAIFWLAQHDEDERVLSLIENILLGN